MSVLERENRVLYSTIADMKSNIGHILDEPDPREIHIERLEAQNQHLTVENKHLRDLLRLAEHEYPVDLLRGWDESLRRSQAPSEASILLTTPPRSPSCGRPAHQPCTRGATRHNQEAAAATTVRAPSPRATPSIDSYTLQEADDIADVGPPLSPPPVARMEPTVTDYAPSASDVSDSEEANEASHVVDNELDG
jgi:hypothetical protein